MPNDSSDVYPPVQYHAIWLTAGITLFVVVIGWYVFVFWLTRRKPVRTVATLQPRDPVLPDMAALRIKYLALIDDVERAVQNGTLKTRGAHQKLSLLLRFFAFEAKGTRAQVLTLADLKKTRLMALVATIEMYYPPEFDAVEHGDVAAAIKTAREVITTWS